MRHLDQFESIAAVSTFVCCGILGNIRTGDFELWPVLEDITPDMERRLRVRGLGFLGVIGLWAGDIGCALAHPSPSTEMCAAISAEFQRRYWRDIVLAYDAGQMGESAKWLDNLHRLPDTRNEA
ncbi:MAG: hypothetical protein WCF68_21280 [Terriglobales bacterium]